MIGVREHTFFQVSLGQLILPVQQEVTQGRATHRTAPACRLQSTPCMSAQFQHKVQSRLVLGILISNFYNAYTFDVKITDKFSPAFGTYFRKHVTV
jgi:hypothetical protein